MHRRNLTEKSCRLVAYAQAGHERGMPGILWDFSEHGKLGESFGNSVQLQGQVVDQTKYVLFVIQIFDTVGWVL